jgi:hypothetical protein
VSRDWLGHSIVNFSSENFYELGIECAGSALGATPASSGTAIPGDRFEVPVGDGDEAASEGDGRSGKMIGVTPTIPPLVVMSYPGRNFDELLDRTQHALTDRGVRLILQPSSLRHVFWPLADDGVRQSHQADIVDECSDLDTAQDVGRNADPLTKSTSQTSDLAATIGALWQTPFEKSDQKSDRIEQSALQRDVGAFQLSGALVDEFFEAFRPLLEPRRLLFRYRVQAAVFENQPGLCKSSTDSFAKLIRIAGLGYQARHLTFVDCPGGGAQVGIAGREDACCIRPAQADGA